MRKEVITLIFSIKFRMSIAFIVTLAIVTALTPLYLLTTATAAGAERNNDDFNWWYDDQPYYDMPTDEDSFVYPLCDSELYEGTANRVCDTEAEEYLDYCYDGFTPHKGECIMSPERARVGTPVGMYSVQPGDTLWGVAERHFGDGSRWRELGTPYVNDPTHLPVGHLISLPLVNVPSANELSEMGGIYLDEPRLDCGAAPSSP